MDNKMLMKWITSISFVLVILGGFNWLLIGLFGFDIFDTLLGGIDSFLCRLIYILFGIGAVILAGIIISKTYYNKKPAPKTTSSRTQAN